VANPVIATKLSGILKEFGEDGEVVYTERRNWDVKTRLLSSIDKASGL